MADDVDPNATRMSRPADGWGAPPPWERPWQGQEGAESAVGKQQDQAQPQLGYQQPQQPYGPPGPSGFGQQQPQNGQYAQRQGRTTRAATRSRVRRGLVWYLLVVALLGTLGMLSEAVNATTSGNDPSLGAHPVMTNATVLDYDVFTCDRSGSCRYDEKLAFRTANGMQQMLTIQGVDTRPTIGGTQTLWYPADDPAAAQTDGPHSAAYYWLATAGFGAVAALLLIVVVRRRRRTS